MAGSSHWLSRTSAATWLTPLGSREVQAPHCRVKRWTGLVPRYSRVTTRLSVTGSYRASPKASAAAPGAAEHKTAARSPAARGRLPAPGKRPSEGGITPFTRVQPMVLLAHGVAGQGRGGILRGHQDGAEIHDSIRVLHRLQTGLREQAQGIGGDSYPQSQGGEGGQAAGVVVHGYLQTS